MNSFYCAIIIVALHPLCLFSMDSYSSDNYAQNNSDNSVDSDGCSICPRIKYDEMASRLSLSDSSSEEYDCKDPLEFRCYSIKNNLYTITNSSNPEEIGNVLTREEVFPPSKKDKHRPRRSAGKRLPAQLYRMRIARHEIFDGEKKAHEDAITDEKYRWEKKLEVAIYYRDYFTIKEAEKKYPEMVTDKLIECGSFDGCQQPHLETLLNAGVNPNREDERAARVLYYAAFNNQKECVRILCEKKANPNIRNSKGETPLFAIARNCWPVTGTETSAENASLCSRANQIISSLLKRGADANIPNNRGVTPLMAAAGRGQAHIIKQLLEEGKANPHARDHKDRNALDHYYGYQQHFEFHANPLVVDILEKAIKK